MAINEGPSLDMATIDESADAMTFVPQDVSEAYRGDAYLPKQQISVPEDVEEDEMFEKDSYSNIALIKRYLSNPSHNVKQLIGNKKYTGRIDSNIDIDLVSLAAEIESKISDVIGENVDGFLLQESPSSIEDSIDMVVRFSKIQEGLEVYGDTLDNRVYKISKILK